MSILYTMDFWIDFWSFAKDFITVATPIALVLIKQYFDEKKGRQEIKNKLDNLSVDVSNLKNNVEEVMNITLENRNGIRYTQRYRLYYDMQKAISRGYTTVGDLEEISVLYESYHSLGGNGAVEALYEKYKNLEIKHEVQD
ncbi:hypothetical protein JXA27_06950 [Aerococcaceae bacterium zg-B36]|uniref:hypothetical protein n=1 Tax=Aerococcaceae bacterium zg-252 TaxID=2796928 RepID=UPI001BD8A231|nr:hypothetical protein [Aerococcaceae bacterium zg-B36]